jgi:AcrR family transcriptional regulator
VPRRPDPELEGKILEAARKLWKKGGETALTMRKVAEAAGTNTPAVYRRFRDRRAIQRALLLRIRQEVADVLEAAASPEEAAERYLDFALTHPHEYELFFQHDYELLHSSRGRRTVQTNRPGVEAMRRKLGARLGGSPDDHARLALALWMVGHGTAMLMLAKTIPPERTEEARSVFRATVALLLREAPGI